MDEYSPDLKPVRKPSQGFLTDPTAWLLEPENPSVRYWTLTDILDRPADDPEVQTSRATIAQQPLVQELFAGQHPDGHWGDDAAKPHTAQGAVGVLSILHMLGVEPDERTAAGCDSLLRFCQHESGGFSMTRTRRSGIFPCTTGEHLPFLVYFGLGDDPRVRRAFAFVIEDMATADALDCGRYQHQDCLWGAIAALNGLAVLPADMHSPQSEQVVRRLADALLDADYDFEGEHKRWLTFGVPRAWDLLSALRALAAHGYAPDPRFAPLLDLFLARQDERGRWLCGSVSRTWPLEKRNRPSKWITLDALRLLKAVHPFDLDENVNDKLVSWRVPENTYTTEEKVTLRRLLSHSAGLQDGFTDRSSSDAVPDYAIVELLMVDVTQQPFPDLVQETVLGPLDMTASTFEQPLPPRLKESKMEGMEEATEHGVNGQPLAGRRLHFPYLAAAGMWTRPSDLARFAIEIMRAYQGSPITSCLRTWQPRCSCPR